MTGQATDESNASETVMDVWIYESEKAKLLPTEEKLEEVLGFGEQQYGGVDVSFGVIKAVVGEVLRQKVLGM